VLILKDLRQVIVVGLGLLGGLIALALSQSFPHTKVVGFSHRSSTRARATQLPGTVYYVGSHPKSRLGAKPDRQDHFGIDKAYECCRIQKTERDKKDT
jgi:esterase/lipase